MVTTRVLRLVSSFYGKMAAQFFVMAAGLWKLGKFIELVVYFTITRLSLLMSGVSAQIGVGMRIDYYSFLGVIGGFEKCLT